MFFYLSLSHLILQFRFINNLAVNNANVFYDYGYALQYDRNIEEYKLSYFFDNMNSSGFDEYKKTVVQKILHKLGLANISHHSRVWNKLLRIESDLQVSANEQSIINFNAFKTNNYYKDFDTLDSKLTARISTYNDEKTLVEPKLKKAIDDSYGLISLEKKDMKKKILAFYNFIYELFDEHIEKMSYNFDYYTGLPVNTLAATFGSYQGGCMVLGKTWNDKKLLKNLYNHGDASSGELEATFVHEFGHVIHNFLAIRANQFSDFTWDTYNTNNTRILDPKCSVINNNPLAGAVLINPEKIVDSLLTFISQKNNQRYGFTDTATFEFISWANDDEWICCGFWRCKRILCWCICWYLTPDSQKNIFWEWLHEYFTKVLISQFVE